MKHFYRKIKAPLTVSLITMVLLAFVFTFSAAGIMEAGKIIYNRNCMECHGTDGMGILAPPFVESTRFKSVDGVVALIDFIMPATSPGLCTGTRVEDVAAYVVQEFKFQVPKDTLDPEKISNAGGRKALFDRNCSVCHGTDGKGDLARPIVKSKLFKTTKDYVGFINGLMPIHNPKKCKDACADNTVRYIIDNFELELSN
jgi:mono/diheme cytochrome c family protein